jgi:hypothetical protein
MPNTTKVTQLRAAYETKYAQAKESGRLDDPEVHQNLKKVGDMLAFLELPEWEFDSDKLDPRAFLDEWWRRHKTAEKAGVPMRSWQECFDKFGESLNGIGRGLDEIEQDLKEIEEEMARCKEQNSDVETDEDDGSNDGKAAASDRSGGTFSVSKAMCEPPLSSRDLPQASTSTSSESSPSPEITLEVLSHQTYLLREALMKSPTTLHTNHNTACTTLCMLEAYNVRNPLRSGYEQCFVLSISNNLDDAQAAFKTLNLPDTHICTTVMYCLSKAFGKLLDSLFESASEAEPVHNVRQSAPQAERPTSLSSGNPILERRIDIFR